MTAAFTLTAASTLVNVKGQAEKLNIPTACITFDQPLWRKTVEIIDAKLLDIVCRLGGFHMMTSFISIGSLILGIGSLMDGSSLSELLETIYGTNSVVHMMSGKAVSRALSAHFLVDAAVMMKVISALLPNVSGTVHEDATQQVDATVETGDDDRGPVIRREGDEEAISEADIESGDGTGAMLSSMDNGMETVSTEKLAKADVELLQEYYEKLRNHDITADDVSECKAVQKLQERLESIKSELQRQSRTAKLWLAYMDYIDTLKLFNRAERTEDWNMHLVAVGFMLNLFAATGHLNYTKSARLYLQWMLTLPSRNPWLYHQYSVNGYHTVRRSDRYWAGLWTDLVIEQVMMRSLKSRGGISRGRGITDSVRLLWVYSMHTCAEVHEAMTSVTGLVHNLCNNGRKRDFDDLLRVAIWITIHNPFDVNQHGLCSLSPGLTASKGDGINCDEVEHVGNLLQTKLDNVKVMDATLQRGDQVRTLIHLKKGLRLINSQCMSTRQLCFLRCWLSCKGLMLWPTISSTS